MHRHFLLIAALSKIAGKLIVIWRQWSDSEIWAGLINSMDPRRRTAEGNESDFDHIELIAIDH